MKRLNTAAALIVAPGLALAHGGHPPVPEAVHGAAHSGLNVGLALVALVAIVWAVRRMRS